MGSEDEAGVGIEVSSDVKCFEFARVGWSRISLDNHYRLLSFAVENPVRTFLVILKCTCWMLAPFCLIYIYIYTYIPQPTQRLGSPPGCAWSVHDYAS